MLWNSIPISSQLSCHYLDLSDIHQPYPFRQEVALHQRRLPLYVLWCFNGPLTCLGILPQKKRFTYADDYSMYNLCTLCYISNIHLVCFTGLLCYSILMLSLVCAFVRCCEFWFHLKQLTFSRFPFEMMYRQVSNLESRYFFLKILASSYRSLLTSGTAKVWAALEE